MLLKHVIASNRRVLKKRGGGKLVASMPRVSFEEFYTRHNQLKKAWEDPIFHFLSLQPREQWYLHDYYRPSEKLTKQELRTHWHALHVTPTSLHQQAGRAYARFRASLGGETYRPQPLTPMSRGKGFRVVVFGTVNPKPDLKLALDAVMMLGDQLRDEAGTNGQQELKSD